MKSPIKKSRLAWAGLAAAALVILILPPVLPPFYVTLITLALIYGLVATSLDVLIGYTMMPSLGHGAYFALGAYTAAIMNTRLGAGFWETLPVSIIVAAGFAAILGLVALRAAGVYFLMITLASAMCVWGLMDQWVDFTGGENGMSGIIRIGFGLDLNGVLSFHYFTAGFFIVCVGLIYLFIKSPFGNTLVGIRDSASRMQVLGYNVWLHSPKSLKSTRFLPLPTVCLKISWMNSTKWMRVVSRILRRRPTTTSRPSSISSRNASQAM